MVAINTAIALDFNAALAQAKLEALNVLRAMLTRADPPDGAAHQRLAAAQILRTGFINLAQPRTHPDPKPAPAPRPADPLPAAADIGDIKPDDIDELISSIPPEQFLAIIAELPGGRLVGRNPAEQAAITAQLLRALREARPAPPCPPPCPPP